MLIRRRIKLVAAVLLFGVVLSCDKDIHPIKSKFLKEPNKTWFVFPYNAKEVKKRVHEALMSERKRDLYDRLGSEGPLGVNHPFSFAIETNETVIRFDTLFDNPDNRNDIYLFSDGRDIAPSEIYFGGGQPLRFSADFHLHISDIDAKSSVVTVFTHNQRVHNGLKCCGPHGRYTNAVPVLVTTIEEYRILEFIGAVLEYRDMPPIKLPEGF